MSGRCGLGVAALLAGLSVVTADDLSPKEREAARKIYVAKCAKCHRFYEPKDYAETDWQHWMESMNRKSKLGPEPGELLIRYLDAYRAGRLPGKPQDRPPQKPRAGG